MFVQRVSCLLFCHYSILFFQKTTLFFTSCQTLLSLAQIQYQEAHQVFVLIWAHHILIQNKVWILLKLFITSNDSNFNHKSKPRISTFECRNTEKILAKPKAVKCPGSPKLSSSKGSLFNSDGTQSNDSVSRGRKEEIHSDPY